MDRENPEVSRSHRGDVTYLVKKLQIIRILLSTDRKQDALSLLNHLLDHTVYAHAKVKEKDLNVDLILRMLNYSEGDKK